MSTISKVYCMLVVALSILSAGHANSESITVITGHSTFDPPDRWEVLNSEVTDTLARFLYFLPFAPANGTEHSANVSFVARVVGEGADTSRAGQIVYSRGYPGYVVLNDCSDNEHWKSYVWRAENGPTVYAGLERIGVANGIQVSALLAFPLLGPESGEKKALMIDRAYHKSDQITGVVLHYDTSLSIVDEFNDFCQSIDIDSTANFRTLFRLYDIPDEGAKAYRPEIDAEKSWVGWPTLWVGFFIWG